LKKSTRIIATCFILILGVSLVIGGCQTSKKPVSPTPSEKPQVTNPTTSKYPQQTANRVTTEAAKVSGVKSAYTVISNRNIYIGLELNSATTSAAQTEKMVVDRVKQMEPGYSVSATSDKNTVASIKSIARGVAGGKPLSNFKNDLDKIDQRLKSTLK